MVLHPLGRDYALQEGEDIVVLGTLPALGNWQQEYALRLTRLKAPYWQAEVGLTIESDADSGSVGPTINGQGYILQVPRTLCLTFSI